MDVLLTCCRNCSLKPALLGFFSFRGTGGAAAAAAEGRVGNTDWDVGCLATPFATEAVAADVDDGLDVVSLPFPSARHCLSSSSSGFDDTLLSEESSSLSAPVASFAVDDMISIMY